MVMKAAFILIAFLILEQVNCKKRVVIHVPSKINNIHHHHVKKVIVYKPVPVKCHHEDNHEWHEGWESTQKDQWLDKRPPGQAPIPHPVSVKHSGWPSPEVIKGGYISGERISSDNWDAAAAAASVKQLKTPLAEIEEDEPVPVYQAYPKKRLPPVNPSGWKVWTPNDVTEARPVNPSKGPNVATGVKLQSTVAQTPKEQYVTYKVVKKKVTKQRLKKAPVAVTASVEPWSDGYKAASNSQEIKLKKPRLKTQYSQDPRVKISQFLAEDSQPQIVYDQDLYVSSSSIKPQLVYPKLVNQNLELSQKQSTRYSPTQRQPHQAQNQNTFYGSYVPTSTAQSYYEPEAYFTSKRPLSAQELQSLSDHPKSYNDHPKSYNDHPKSYNDPPKSYNDPLKSYNDLPKSYNEQDLYSEHVSRPLRTDQEPYTFNAQNIKVLLDQHVPTIIDSYKPRPNYDLNVHNSHKIRPNSSSYQMRYSHSSNTTPVAFLINHRNMNVDQTQKP